MEQKPPTYASATSADHLTCQQATALLAAYVNDTLAPETLRAFQEHVHDCADCLAYLQTYRTTLRALGMLRYEDIPAVLQDRLLSFLHTRVTGAPPSAPSRGDEG
jgi:putative zinc finger protein